MFIDTHFHIDSNNYAVWDNIITQAKLMNVKYLIISACDKKSIDTALSFVDKFDNLYLTIGFHPEYADQITESDLIYLEQRLRIKKVVGIGEVGLDYHYSKENKIKQQWLFRKQLELAVKYNKTVVIHTRDAVQDTYDILSEYKVKGVIHCFSESFEMATLFIKKGFYLGIGGVLTFKNSKLWEIAQKMPLEKMLLETDSPYLSPEPHRGERNGPWNIPIIATKIAEIKEVSIKDVAVTTTINAKSLFDLSINL